MTYCCDGELSAAEGNGSGEALWDPLLDEGDKVLVRQVRLSLLYFENHVVPQVTPVLLCGDALVHVPLNVAE